MVFLTVPVGLLCTGARCWNLSSVRKFEVRPGPGFDCYGRPGLLYLTGGTGEMCVTICCTCSKRPGCLTAVFR